MKRFLSFITLAAAIACAPLLVCGPTEPQYAGNSTQVGNPGAVAGIIYEPDGRTPAADVNVAIRSKKTLADTAGSGLGRRLADTASAMTDDSGRFAFDSTLDTGLYVIEADDGDGNMALIDSVQVVDPDSTVRVEDTLQRAGAITGIVYLSEGGDARKVFILAMGLDRFTRPDSTGRFTFGNLAEANYDLTLISSLDDYAVLDVPAVEVLSGGTRNVDTLRLPFTGIPTPRGLSLAYDTLRQIVTLTWNQADMALVSGYNIYRKHSDSDFVKINVAPIADTIFADSEATQNETYQYQVKALDQNSDEGTFSTSVIVTIAKPFELIATWGGQGTGDAEFTEISDLIMLSDGRLMAIDYGDHKVQILGSDGTFVRAWGGEGSADGDFTNPIAGAVDDSGYLYVLEMLGTGRIQKFDTAGTFIQSWVIGQYCRGLGYSEGNLYIASTNPAGIKSLELSSGTVGIIALPGSDPVKIFVGTAGAFYVSDDSQSLIIKTDSTGITADSWGGLGSRNGQFVSPGDIALQDNGNVFVADPNNGRIQVFTGNGVFVTKLIIAQITAGSIEAPVEKRPRAIAFDAGGNLLVADSHFIYQYALQIN